MNIQNESDGGNPEGTEQKEAVPVPAAPRINKEPCPLVDFYDFVQVGHTEAIQGFVFAGRTGQPNDHLWNARKMDFGPWSAEKVKGRKPAYLIMSAFTAGHVSRDKGRSKNNVVAVRGFWMDIEGSADKFAKPGGEDGGYKDGPAALKGVDSFCKAVAPLLPNFLVLTGSGGVHLHFVLDKAITLDVWMKRAKALVALAQKHGLKIDAQCTTDPARIMRAPGSIHQKTGREVTAHQWRPEPYTLEEWDRLVGCVPGADAVIDIAAGPMHSGGHLNVNGDILGDHPKYSYTQAAERCPAMRQAGQREGRDTPYPVWMLAVKAAALATEGREFAHSISGGHPDYDEATTDKKIDSLTGGPAGCEAWANAYGAGGPCESCEYRGKIKNPAIQLGALVETAPPDGAMVGATVPKLSREVLKTELADWYVNKDGEKIKPMMTTVNVRGLLRANGWNVQYNVMNKRVETIMPGSRAPRDDHENAALAFLGDVAVRAGMSRDGLPELVDAVAGENAVHPAQSWIESTPWDGTSRLSLFHDSLELVDVNHAPLRDALMDAWALQGIGAIYEPEGIAAQGALTLVGAQECNKTRWVANLCPVSGAVRTGLHLNPLDKDSVLRATNGWIGELGELDSTTRKADQSALKAFLTSNEDILRPPYARKENVYRRRTVFAGTVNGTGFLADDTGDRRFWAVAVKRCHLLPAETMQQIWAEYLEKYRAGERWHLDSQTKALLSNTNAAHRVVDPIRERIITMFDWASIDWDEVAQVENPRARPNLQWLTATDICIRIGLDRPSKADATRAGSVTSELNRATFRKSNGAKLLAVPGLFRGGL